MSRNREVSRTWKQISKFYKRNDEDYLEEPKTKTKGNIERVSEEDSSRRWTSGIPKEQNEIPELNCKRKPLLFTQFFFLLRYEILIAQ